MSLRDKIAAKNASMAAAYESNTPVTRPRSDAPKTAPGRLLEAMPLLAEKEEQVTSLENTVKELREALQVASNAGIDLQLSALIEVAGRRRKMTEEKFIELRENLRHNKLIHPVVVRKASDGKYEIVSGHHRVDAYREIGRETIRTVVIDGSDDEIADGAFNANMMQSGLTDYEKYLGFKIRLERTPGLTQVKLAEKFGVTPALVSYIFSFDQLPLDALSLIEARPEIIGATAVSTLVGLVKQGKTKQVLDAINRLVAGELDQGQAVKLARQSADKPKPQPALTVKIKQGKATYCEIRRAKNVMRLNFKSEEEAERIQEAIQRLLEDQSSHQNDATAGTEK